ncbi:hypothetical protein HCN44_007921 [Aphidius gifuensis]|uniref:Uncharacterized protein n=1 Tax=Aphidius gifuensis TaxID=684658 RepID=A0A835CTG1_APHGI|nr:hypothetical protein HCN44_007921 [Aphidius gifuensis]
MDNHSTSNKTVKIPLENPGVVTINENIGSGQDVIYNSTSETDTDKTVNNDDLPPPPKRKRKNNKLNNQASKAVQPSQSLHAKKINTLCNIVKEIQKDVKQLKNGIIQKPADLEGDYNITLPIKKMIDLVSLEKKLKENKDCRKDVVNYIKQVGEEAKTLPGFTRCILRAFFIRKVAVKLSAARQKMETKEHESGDENITDDTHNLNDVFVAQEVQTLGQVDDQNITDDVYNLNDVFVAQEDETLEQGVDSSLKVKLQQWAQDNLDTLRLNPYIEVDAGVSVPLQWYNAMGPEILRDIVKVASHV